MLQEKKKFLFFLGTGIGLIFLWLAVRQTDVSKIREALGVADLSYVPLILFFIILFFWFKTTRWRTMLSPLANIRTASLFPVVVVGYASNILLPAQLGELVRTYLACRKYRIQAGPVLVTVVLERMFDFLTILLFVGMIVAFEKNVPDQLVLVGYVCGGIGVLMLLLATLHIARPDILSRVFFLMTAILPEKARNPLNMQFEQATIGLESLKNVRLLAAISITSPVLGFLPFLLDFLIAE